MKSNRLSILNKQEFSDLYGIPKFTKDDRVHFFAINDEEIGFLKRLVKPNLKAFFLLQLGFFKAKNRFFDIDLSKHYQDLRYIKLHFLNGAKITFQQPNKNSMSRYRAKILDLTGYRAFDDKAKCAAKKFAKTSARRNLKPRAIFAEILDFLKESNYELPEYSYLCDLVGQVIEFEQKRLAKIVRSVTKAKKKAFDQFLTKNADYSFATVKEESKSLKFGEIKDELERHQTLAEIFPVAEMCIKLFEVSPHNIKYLASLADHYKLSSLRGCNPIL